MVAFDTSDLGAFVGNPEVEKEGVWFPLTDKGEDGPMLKLAFANPVNDEYATAFEKEFRKHRKLMQANGGNLPKHLADPLMSRIMAQVIIRDWKNFKDKDGAALSPTFENKLALMTDYPRMREMAIAFAKEGEYFSDSSVVHDETDVGNSKRSSRGGSNSAQTQNT